MNLETLTSLSAWAGRTSLEALPLALVALLLARWRRLPMAWRWWLPALVFLRLAMPQVPEVAWRPDRLSLPLPSAQRNGEALKTSEVTSAAPARPAIRRAHLLAAAWALGATGVAAWLITGQLRLRRTIARGTTEAPEELQQLSHWAAARMGIGECVPVKVMRSWSTLAVSGAWRPVLLVPDDLTERFTVTQLRGMFLHEMAHVRRRDVLWTWLALGLCALHWFNPLAWLALRRFHADRELACDAAALRALDAPARHEYGEALLRCLDITPPPATAGIAPFFRHFPELKQRLQNIMNPATPTAFSRIVTSLLVPALAVVTFTASRANADGERAPRDGEKPSAERPAREGERGAPREGEQPRNALRDGERPREGARDGEQPRRGSRDGERPRDGARDGDRPREGAREGDRPAEGARDGERPRRPMRDGERAKEGAREGERPREGARDGEQPRRGLRDGERPREGVRDGEKRPEGERDAERPRRGPRDGEQPKAGPRDGDRPREGARDGDRPREGARDGEAPKAGPREGDQAAPGAKPEGR